MDGSWGGMLWGWLIGYTVVCLVIGAGIGIAIGKWAL